MQCGRSIPIEFSAHCHAMGFSLTNVDLTTEVWKNDLPSSFAVALLLPAWSGNLFLAPQSLWYRFLLQEHSHLRLFFVSYEKKDYCNHFDLLKLDEYTKNDWHQAPNVAEMPPFPFIEGVNLHNKLERFFAGHGDDSVVAVLSRIRLVVQMASRELSGLQTPYSEIFKELVQPAQLHLKWVEWKNRWIHYYPLFQFTPFAAELEKIANLTDSLEEWMSSGGQDEQGVKDGRVLSVLNEVRLELKLIEEQYVVKKLSHSYS